jgi:hypothetical protein
MHVQLFLSSTQNLQQQKPQISPPGINVLTSFTTTARNEIKKMAE